MKPASLWWVRINTNAMAGVVGWTYNLSLKLTEG
jgi:hypothetical protein